MNCNLTNVMCEPCLLDKWWACNCAAVAIVRHDGTITYIICASCRN